MITAPYFTALLVHIIESKHNWVFEYTVITAYSAKTSLFMRVYCTTRNYYDLLVPASYRFTMPLEKKRINASTTSHPHLSNWITITYPNG